MKDAFKFLSKLGQFSIADKTIPDGSFEELQKNYHTNIMNHNFKKARQIALKLTLQYGLEGLYLYLSTEISSIRKNKKNHEIIDQSVIQLLGLILFVENHLNSPGKLFEEQKQSCLEMIDLASQNEVKFEAQALSEFYKKN